MISSSVLHILVMTGKQRVLSSYFSQPAKTSSAKEKPAQDNAAATSAQIDLTLSDSDSDVHQPPAKRARISPSADAKNAASSSPPPADSLMSSSMGQKWSLTPITEARTSIKATSSSGRSKAEVEALRKKLGGDTKGKLASTENDKKRQREPSVLEESGGENDGKDMEDNEGESEEAPSQLAKFANTSSRKGGPKPKAKASASKPAAGSGGGGKRPKKVEEVGPAGLKYTPLEKQVRCHPHHMNIG